MPIYEFECSQCGHRFDRLQRLSDPDPANCPQCQAAPVQRRISAPTFRLAGSGWYETDFKKDGDKKRNLAGDAGAPAPAPAASAEVKTGAPASSTSAPAAAPAPASAPAPAKSPSSSGGPGSDQ